MRQRRLRTIAAGALMLGFCTSEAAAQAPAPQQAVATPGVAASEAPIHRNPPRYPIPYPGTEAASVKAVLDRVLTHIEGSTPMAYVRADGGALAGRQAAGLASLFAPGHYRLVSYEWGVTYSGAMLAGAVTGDARYTRYAADRINFVADVAAHYRTLGGRPENRQIRAMNAPESLDDSGAMAAALIKAQRAGLAGAAVRPQIDIWLDFVSNKQFRLADGTLARQRPYPDTLWLDDLYMSVPALAQMGALTGERRWFDDAVRQVVQFSDRMFVPEIGLYMHGWVQGMDPHPRFFWGRANGWAVMTMVELLDVLPADHPGRGKILALLRAHVAGLARLQSGTGLWHQLLDRNDSYKETSATAIFAFAIARSVNRGWIDRSAYGPVAMLAWNGVTTKVNPAGEVEDVCVGTGMGFDPAFYYYRPVHVRAAHGYGPVLLAGAEILTMLKSPGPRPNSGGAVSF
ncbi:glycoside hydrolase family 88/105 protein [Sphingomonas sp. M1-B02]|uniref:glycoside hydrolase family 88/105 protein n=1 Tax=Sphingomonas sp. M1-B02 TaxID=3114300 RepID=UPI00223FC886|nr:glycoside hydrolase family 88 protein [Sphingomonas sp. S6-11]UZK67421.1 glycoside hydrolase family 88 protein [Sphingomonas sp. S6-11]